MDSNSSIPAEAAEKFNKSVGSNNYLLTRHEPRENGIAKLHATCLPCQLKGISKTIVGDTKSSGNFIKHLQNKHPEDYQLFLKQKEVKRPRLDPGQSTLDSFRLGVIPASKIRVDKLIVNYIVSGLHPLSTVEDEAFRDLIKGAMNDQTLSFMDCKTLKKRIMEKYSEMKSRLVNLMDRAKIIALTADVWSSRARSYLGVTCNFINEDLTMANYTLCCRRFKGCHTYDRLAKELNKIMEDFGIRRDKVVAIVTDNGSNFVKAFKEFGLDFDEDDDVNQSEVDPLLTEELNDDIPVQVSLTETLDSTGDMEYSLPPHLRCVAHSLNLIATTDMKKTIGKGLLHKAMGKCVKLFNLSSSPKTAEIIESICGKRLKTPSVTRWNSLFDSLKHLLSVEEHIDSLCNELGTPLITPKEKEFLKEYVKISQPLALALDKLQSDKFIYFGDLLPTLKGLQGKLMGMKNSVEHTKAFIDTMVDAINKRFENVLSLNPSCPSDYLYAAMSHPTFKLRWLPTSIRSTLKNSFIERCTELSGKRSFLPNVQQSQVQVERSEDDLYEFYEDLSSLNASSDNEKIKLECFQYFENASTDLGILKLYPSVENIFRRYNTCLPSSASAERLFSAAGLVLTPRRSRLSDELFDVLVFLRANKNL